MWKPDEVCGFARFLYCLEATQHFHISRGGELSGKQSCKNPYKYKLLQRDLYLYHVQKTRHSFYESLSLTPKQVQKEKHTQDIHQYKNTFLL